MDPPLSQTELSRIAIVSLPSAGTTYGYEYQWAQAVGWGWTNSINPLFSSFIVPTFNTQSTTKVFKNFIQMYRRAPRI